MFYNKQLCAHSERAYCSSFSDQTSNNFLMKIGLKAISPENDAFPKHIWSTRAGYGNGGQIPHSGSSLRPGAALPVQMLHCPGSNSLEDEGVYLGSFKQSSFDVIGCGMRLLDCTHENQQVCAMLTLIVPLMH